MTEVNTVTFNPKYMNKNQTSTKR